MKCHVRSWTVRRTNGENETRDANQRRVFTKKNIMLNVSVILISECSRQRNCSCVIGNCYSTRYIQAPASVFPSCIRSLLYNQASSTDRPVKTCEPGSQTRGFPFELLRVMSANEKKDGTLKYSYFHKTQLDYADCEFLYIMRNLQKWI